MSITGGGGWLFVAQHFCTAKELLVGLGGILAKRVLLPENFFGDCLKKSQTQSFCATGAHWQNGIVERTIGIVTTLARSMLSHAMRQWPEVVTEQFWSFAVRHAVNILNMMPRSKLYVSNHQKFTGERPPIKPTDFHVFGCPAYVLDEKLQNDKGG